MGVHRGVRQGERRVPLREGAQLLGVSKDAVRQRIRRGTIRSEKGEDGRVYVYVDASPDAVHGQDQATHGDSSAGTDLVVDELRDRIRYLERQVEEERNARYRADELLARLMDRVPQLEPPSEPPGEPTAATVEPGRVGPQTEVVDPQEGAQRRSWWRSVFGG